jgi:TetR/AcrR family transcriptional regulator, fatty acid metabolism regulator protein
MKLWRIEMTEKSSANSTKDRILRAATRLFAEQGYQKTTIIEISKEAGFSEAALYEYFQGKEDLLNAIPNAWSEQAVAEVKEQLFGIKGAENKLRKFLWWYLRHIEKQSLTAKVVFLHLKVSRTFVDSPVYPHVKTFYSFLIDIFEEGKKTGEFREDLEPYLARAVFIGTIEHIVIRWLLKDMSYSLFDTLEQIFEILINGVSKAEPAPGNSRH